MVNRPTESVQDQPQERLKAGIGLQQSRTRDRVFRTTGNVVELTIDTGEFIVQSSAYATGRAVLATGRGFKALYEGVLGKHHPRT